MAHLTCTFSSECLKMNTSLTVILPEQVQMDQIRVVLTDFCLTSIKNPADIIAGHFVLLSVAEYIKH